MTTAPSASSPSASSTVEVAATPAAVYDLVTDLTTLAELADEAMRMRWRGSASAAAPGAVFKGTNRNGWRRWTTTCTVTDADAGQRFAFDVSYVGVPIARWQYDIVASGGGCTVTESTWDRRPGWMRPLGGLATGVADRPTVNGAHIDATLRRLKARAEA